MSVGIAKAKKFNKVMEEGEIKLDKGDIILQYTDGVTEAYDNDENLFGDDRLIEVMLKNGDKSPQELIEAIVAAIEEHAAGAEQSDDIALMALKIEEKE